MPESENQHIKRTILPSFRRKRKEDGAYFPRREKVVVFIVAYVISISLWLLVNLNREYNLSVNLPLQLAQLQENQALADEPPEFATVSIVGEGWKLLNIYNNPPSIRVDPRGGYINLEERAKETMGIYLDVNVQKVDPMVMNLTVEDKISKKVPVVSNVDLSFRRQFDLTGEPVILPDSITVRGARSLVEQIEYWETESKELKEIKEPVHRHIPLKKPSGLIELDYREVLFRAEVSEFTEGEIRIYVKTRDLPDGHEVRFSPSIVTVKYDVPIEEYAEVQDIIPYEAYVTYEEILSDTTGYITPTVSKLTDDLKIRLRSLQPRRVAYFNVVSD